MQDAAETSRKAARKSKTEVMEKCNSLIPSSGPSAVSGAQIEISNFIVSQSGADISNLHGKSALRPGTLRQSPAALVSKKLSGSGTVSKDTTMPLSRPYIELSTASDVSYNGESPKPQGKLLTTPIPITQPFPRENTSSSSLQILIAKTREYLHTFKDLNERKRIWLKLIRTTATDCSTIKIAHEQSELATFFWTYPFSLSFLGSEAQFEWQYQAQSLFRLDKPSNSLPDYLRFSNAVFDPAPVTRSDKDGSISTDKQIYNESISTKTLPNFQRSAIHAVTPTPSPTDVDLRTADKVSCPRLQTDQGYAQSTSEPYGWRENANPDSRGAKVVDLETETTNSPVVRSRSHSATEVIVDEMIKYLASSDQIILGNEEMFGQEEGPSESDACIECRKIKESRLCLKGIDIIANGSVEAMLSYRARPSKFTQAAALQRYPSQKDKRAGQWYIRAVYLTHTRRRSRSRIVPGVPSYT
ncbi:MAG: hypothetical protein Q9182_006595 [Xanthomendoza sp. 2 TL-2023]